MENNKPVSLEDLNATIENSDNFVDTTVAVEATATQDTHEIATPVEVDIASIKEYSPTVSSPTMADNLFAKLDERLMEEKEVIAETRAKAEEIMLENQLEEEESKDNTIDMAESLNSKDDDEDDVDVESTFSEVNEKDFFDDIDMGDDEEDREETKEEEDAKNKQVKDAVSEKLVPIQNKIDMSQFSISKKPISISRLLSMDTTVGPTADWILYAAGRPISMSGLHGAEIDKLNIEESNRNRLNALKDMYQIVYNHILDANKPATFEAWIKTVRFFDIPHLFFAVYRATFAGSNTVPYTCTNPKCEKVFMRDLAFDDMVKYATPEAKERVKNILEMDSTTETEEYKVDLVQVSDTYVFGMKDPTVYTVLFETAALDRRVTDKYQDLIGVMAYIDDIYYINRETNELVAIDTKPDPSNAVKTTMRRFKAYYQILNTLTSDQFYTLSGKIKKISDFSDDVVYIMPADVCPHCGTHIEEEKKTPINMLFMRHQLGAIANI